MKIPNSKFCYVRNINTHGDKQGILFERERTWEDIKSESHKLMRQHDFANLIKNVADMRGVNANGVPVSVADIQVATGELLESTSSESSSIYIDHGMGHLEHRHTGVHYMRGYASSCVLEANPDANRKARQYRSGRTAAKQVIRTMTPMGYWKTAKLIDAEIYHDDQALLECANDYLISGKHHLVKGYIPTEVFQVLRR